MRRIKRKNRQGMGTVEIVIIIAVLVSLALLFREGLMAYGKKIINFCFDETKIQSAF